MTILQNFNLYGSINLDWTIQWIDIFKNKSNNATFNNSTELPGTFTYYTKPIDSSGGGTVSPSFYNGTLNEIYLYNNTGGYVTTLGGSTYYPVQMTYNTSQYGAPFFYLNNLTYLNLDQVSLSKFYITNNDGSSYLIDNFNVTFDFYKTLYESNFKYDLNTSNGCKLYENYFVSNKTIVTSGNNTNTYIVYMGTGIEIPETLRTIFNIEYENSLNIFTNIKSNAIINNSTKQTYWQNFSNNYGNPQNTGWIIAQVIISD